MAEIQARALYDFAGDPGNNELSFYTNEVLTITNKNIGEGWWEAANSRGESGFIPETYVEITSMPEPSFPPPPAPIIPSTFGTAANNTRPTSAHNQQQFNKSTHANNRSSSYKPATNEKPAYRSSVNQWTNENGAFKQPDTQSVNQTSHYGQSTNQYNSRNAVTNQESYDGWDDDDWDDDDDDESGTTDQDTHQRNSTMSAPGDRAVLRSSSPSTDQSKYGTVKKSFSRFSTFAKSGGEAYLLGETTAMSSVPETDFIKIIDTTSGPQWEPSHHPFTCTIAQPHKESKLKGLKSFIAYQLTPSFSNIQVSRRYKHFDWLHQRLEEKFVCIPIAPLPEKAISGRYEDDFIAERMRLLQLWLNRVVRHPVLSQCDVLNHFLTCTDEKKKWKQGKRRAEKDEYTSAKFFLTVQTPPQPLDIKRVDETMENFGKFVRGMDEGLKHVILVVHDNMKRHSGPFKREYQKLGNAFKDLAASFQFDVNSYSTKLTQAVEHTGSTYNDIGTLFENQASQNILLHEIKIVLSSGFERVKQNLQVVDEERPRYDSVPLLAGLYEYKGLLCNYPDVLKIQEGALLKAKECLKQQEEGKLSESDVQNVVQRADVISYSTIAEMKHFQHERVADFTRIMKQYLVEQINFYKQITNKLEETLKEYEKA